MGTPKLSSVRQGPSSNHQHHEGFHLPLPRGRRHGRGRSPVPLRQLRLQHLQRPPLRRRLQPLHLRRHPPPRQEGGRGRPRSRLQQRLPLPLCLQRNLQHALHHPLHLRPPPLRQEGCRAQGRRRSHLQRPPLPLHLRLWPPQLRLQRSLQPRHLQRNPHLRQARGRG